MRALTRPLVVRDEFQAADAVVVLGAPLRRDGSLSQVLEERVRAGVDLWRRGAAPLLCFAGGPTRGAKVAEAEVMARAARALGVPDEAIRLEVRSGTTEENACEIAKLGIGRRVWVVTQPFHLRRARLWFRRVGLEPLGWYIEDSVQFSRGFLGLRWTLREYGALGRDWLRQ